MPFSSHQVNSLMTGQSAMFGNVANYAGSIGPGGRPGSFASGPVYDPATFTMPPPLYDVYGQNLGARAMGAGLSIAQSALPMAALAGSFLPGMAGRAFSMMDPTYAGLSGFVRGAGLMHGIGPGSGLVGTAEGMLSNAGRIASGGFGNIARAGISGLGAGMVSFLPAFAATQAIGWGAGQMMEGVRHNQQVQEFLQREMRFTNPMSRTGFGFNRNESAQIASSIRDIARQPESINTNLRELTSVMEQGVSGGMFRAVQDATTFQKKFKELTDTLRTVAKTMNTTLAGAMPFLIEARKMGFWTPSDVVAASQITRGASIQTGMSVAETQQAMGAGAAMARSVGAQGAYGALGMQRTLSVVGGGLRSGVISEQALQEATGMQGPEAVRAFSETLQAGATRFASSRTGRWMLASLANKDFTGFDKSRLASFMSGNMHVGDIQRTAEKNVAGRHNAAAFLMGEEDLRGELLSQGPMGQVAFIRGALGDRLHGTGAMDKYVTRRMIQRFMNVNARTADMFAELARNQPKIIRENAERELNQQEQELRQQDVLLNHSFGGAMRKLGHRFENTALLEWGARGAQAISGMWESAMDKVWGREAPGSAVRGISAATSAGLRRDILTGTSSFGRPVRSREELAAEMASLDSRLGIGGPSALGGVLGSTLGSIGGGAGSFFGNYLGRNGMRSGGLSDLQGVAGFAEAARDMASGGLAGERAMTALLNKGNLSDKQRGALESIIKMSQAGGDSAKTLREVMGDVSSNIDSQRDLAYAETIKGRMGSAMKQIAGREDYYFGSANAIKGKGGADLGLGDLLKKAMTSSFDPNSRKDVMQKLAHQIQAGGSGAAEKLLALLPDTPEFAGIRGMVGMAGEGAAASKITNWGSQRGIGEIGRLLGEFGAGGFGKDEYKILTGKDTKARDELISRTISGLGAPQASAVKDLLTSLTGKGAGAGVSKAFEQLSAMIGTSSDIGLSKMKNLSGGELQGQLGGRGSMSGIHDTLTRMLNLQEQYFSSESGGKFQYKAPEEKPPEH